jgi:Fe-Mn family superoxide dismutase
MERQARDYSHLLGRLTGISDVTLQAHFGLYEGYVKALNHVERELKVADRGSPNYSYDGFSELKRRLAVPFNGMALHELYFDNLGATADAGPDGAFERLVSKSFGSFDAWLADTKATGAATNGWVVSALDLSTGRLHNVMLQEHHVGWPVRHIPLLVLDTWEHAFYKDFGSKRAAYIDAFFKNLNWGIVLSRLTAAENLLDKPKTGSVVEHAQFRE